MSDFNLDSLSSGDNSELQDLLQVEQQKALFQAQVHRINEICWEKCVDKTGSKLDGRTETCLSNCVDRFIDTTFTVTQRFAQLIQRSANQMN